MKELLTTNDPVFLSALRHHLSLEDVAFDVFDSYVGGLFPGELSIASCRVMVSEDDFYRASRVLDRLQTEDASL